MMNRKDLITVSILLIVIGLISAGFIYANFLAPGDGEEKEENEDVTSAESARAIGCESAVSDNSVDRIAVLGIGSTVSLTAVP